MTDKRPAVKSMLYCFLFGYAVLAASLAAIDLSESYSMEVAGVTGFLVYWAVVYLSMCFVVFISMARLMGYRNKAMPLLFHFLGFGFSVVVYFFSNTLIYGFALDGFELRLMFFSDSFQWYAILLYRIVFDFLSLMVSVLLSCFLFSPLIMVRVFKA